MRQLFNVLCAMMAFPVWAVASMTQAVAIVHPTEGNKVEGKVTFTLEGQGMHIVADLHGLTPGKHGFHIHELGDCSAKDASSAGGHFNPNHKKHGCPDSAEHHAGDLGNIVANAQGDAHLDIWSHELTFSGTNDILGKSVIVHADPDDCVSQPTGNSGARVGCGVIQPSGIPVKH